MKTLYFDLIGGVSGDMVVASLLDMGRNLNYLRRELRKIDRSQYWLKFFRQKQGHIHMGRFVVVDTAKKKRIYQFKAIVTKIKQSKLSRKIKKDILNIYRALYQAEKKVHRSKATHFHQIGEIDSIIDITSTCILIDRLGVGRILYSSVPFGKKVAPATAQLLISKDVYFSKHPFENITPTGVAILTTLGKQSRKGILRNLTVERLGYGRGSFQSNGLANGLRAIVLKKTNFKTRSRKT